MYSDVAAQIADYRGVLGWNSFTNAFGTLIPAIEVALYCKEHSIPSRKPKFTELYSAPMLIGDGTKLWNNQLRVIFEGSPDPLAVDISGWIITPTSNNKWAPVSKTGATLNLGNVSYADIVTMFITGQMTPTVSGYVERKDPDYYISPYGQQYVDPVIISWEPSYAPVQKKQPFTLSMYLEK